MRWRLNLLFALFPLLFLTLPTVAADRGGLSLSPDVSIYEPGQKAIVAWNGYEEILILSTDVHASKGTLILEMLPLPSNPREVKEASFESFVAVQRLIWEHTPPPGFSDGFLGRGRAEGVEVVFHEKIGSHDITIVKASNASELAEWAEGFLRDNGIDQKVSFQEFEPIIEDYMAEGFQFFVLDLIEVSSKKNSVEPILYRFETNFLYYPLKISTSFSGDTKITLFLITKTRLEGAIPHYPFKTAFYHGSVLKPIRFKLTNAELSSVDAKVGELFEDSAWLTVLEYEGAMDKLTKDLVIMEGSMFLSPPLVLLLCFGLVIFQSRTNKEYVFRGGFSTVKAGLDRIIKAVAWAVAIFGFIFSLSAVIHLLGTALRYTVDTLWTIYRLILGIIIVYISWILYKMGETKK